MILVWGAWSGVLVSNVAAAAGAILLLLGRAVLGIRGPNFHHITPPLPPSVCFT